MLTLVCAYCHNPAAHALRAVITEFTFFFIPLFTVRTRHHLQCTFCGATAEVPRDHVDGLLARAHDEGVQAGRYGPGQPGPAAPAPTQPNPPWPQQR